MRWADALRASKVSKARRPLSREDDRGEPSVILIDPKFPKAPKAFHVVGDEYGWTRVPLKAAGGFTDWEPVSPREAIEELGNLA